MQCPKCGNENVIDRSYINEHCTCIECRVAFTVWQQEEISRLRIIEQSHSLCAEAIQGFQEELESLKYHKAQCDMENKELRENVAAYLGYKKKNERLQYQLSAEVDNHHKQCAETIALQKENERLQAEIGCATAFAFNNTLNRTDDDIVLELDAQLDKCFKAFKAENERLRAALVEIRDHEHCQTGCKWFGIQNSLCFEYDENQATIKGHRCAAAIAEAVLKSEKNNT